IQGELLGILRDRARNRTLNLRVILELGADDTPSAALIVSAEATAQRELPIYAAGDDVGHDAPTAALAIGDTCWVHGGRAYVFMGSKAGKGKVLLSGLRFGTRAVEPKDDQAVHGLLTHDGEDDPIEEAPMFTRGGETLPVVGPLVGLLRERARNRRVSLQGERTAEGFRATAIRAEVTRTTELKDDQPMGYLEPGAEVWVTGGRVYVQVISEKGEGTVAARDLSFGERPAPGVIDALQGNDD
ncbi:MAG: hypothetical protein KDD82_21915, partial [Planctomycetes bacterium]|nr:hypothetical protein [Planctomycetota bacterium]